MNRFVLGDCLTVLPTLAARSVDFVLTDPPYLMNYQDRKGRSIANDKDDGWLVPAFQQIHRVLRNEVRRRVLSCDEVAKCRRVRSLVLAPVLQRATADWLFAVS